MAELVAASEGALSEIIQKGSKSFSLAAKLLPVRVRRDALILYAFCRDADDCIDSSSDPAEGLAVLHGRLDQIYGKGAESPLDHALAELVQRKRIGRPILEALIEGFAWDVDARRYATLTELEDYAMRVAGTVGLMMALIMDTQDRNALYRASELGVAMQLTNICRDVGEDARRGRIYLPEDLLQSAGLGLQSADLAVAPQAAALKVVVQRLLARADDLYARAESGIASLPRDARWAIAAASAIYREIGREIERHEYNVTTHRAHTSVLRKVWLVAKAWFRARRVGRQQVAESLPAARFLIERMS